MQTTPIRNTSIKQQQERSSPPCFEEEQGYHGPRQSGRGESPKRSVQLTARRGGIMPLALMEEQAVLGVLLASVQHQK